MNFAKNETLKMWILWKMRLSKCEFCQKWDFQIVNFWIKLRTFAPVWVSELRQQKNHTLHTGVKFHIFSKNHILKILFFDKIHIFKVSFLTKFTISKSHFWQIHIFKVSFFTKFKLSKSHFWQNSNFQNLIFHKIHIFKISFFTKFTFFKHQMLDDFWLKSWFLPQCVILF